MKWKTAKAYNITYRSWDIRETSGRDI